MNLYARAALLFVALSFTTPALAPGNVLENNRKTRNPVHEPERAGNVPCPAPC